MKTLIETLPLLPAWTFYILMVAIVIIARIGLVYFVEKQPEPSAE